MLRTLLQALLAVHALIGPSLLVDGLLVALLELGSTLGVVGRRLVGQGQQLLIHCVIVVGEVAWNVYVVWARHTVAAGCTGNGGIATHAVGDASQQGILLFRTGVER